MIDANSSGGGVTSWNDLEDRPFGSETVLVEPVFNGDTTGREIVQLDPQTRYIKMADEPIVDNSYIGSEVVIIDPNGEMTVTLTEAEWRTADTSYAGLKGYVVNIYGMPMILCITEDSSFIDTQFTTGVWFMDIGIQRVKSWSCLSPVETEVINTLDEEYIPDTIARVKDIPKRFSGSWNDLTDKPFGKMTEFTPCAMDEEIPVHTGSYDVYAKANDYTIPTFTQNDEYRVTFDGVVYICRVKYLAKGDETLVFGNRHLYNASYDDTGEPFFVTAKFDPRNGDSFTFVVADPSVSHTVSVEYDSRNQIKKIDAKYLPKGAEVANATGETVSASEFNALLDSLRNAGYLSK